MRISLGAKAPQVVSGAGTAFQTERGRIYSGRGLPGLNGINLWLLSFGERGWLSLLLSPSYLNFPFSLGQKPSISLVSTASECSVLKPGKLGGLLSCLVLFLFYHFSTSFLPSSRTVRAIPLLDG